LPTALIPPRPETSLTYDAGLAPAKSTEFGRYPANSTLLHPLITVLVAIALFLGVGSAWHISVSTPDAGISSTTGDDNESTQDPQEQVNRLLAQIRTLSPSAESNILSLYISRDGNDRAEVYDPATGESIGISYAASSDSWNGPEPDTTDARSPRTFRGDDLTRMQFTAIVEEMERLVPEPSRYFESMTVKRDGDDKPVLATAAFGDDIEDKVDIEANTDGVVATWFNPGDFQTSMTLAQEMLVETGIPTDQPFLTRVEIRGDPDAATISAGDIQNTSGVLVEYTDLKSSGTVSRSPGHFPSVRPYGENKAGRLREGSIAFTEVSAATFEQVRNDAMRRGNVDTFDRNLVDIEASYRYVRALGEYQTVISVKVGPDPLREEVYSLDGQYLATGN
jgi:hypothetical protein